MPNVTDIVAGLRRERDYYERTNRPDRVALVDAELARLGANEPAPEPEPEQPPAADEAEPKRRRSS